MGLSIDERVRIILLAGNGITHREIAEKFNKLHPDRRPVPPGTVANVIAKFKETGSVCDRPRPSFMLESFNRVFGRNDVSEKEKERFLKSQKGFRYAVVNIGGESGYEIFDILMNNGYNDFLLLNDLADHPDLKHSSHSKGEKSSDSAHCNDQQINSQATLSTNAETTTDAPYSMELSATDLLGSSGDTHDHKPVVREENPCDGTASVNTSRDGSEGSQVAGRVHKLSESSVEEIEVEPSTGGGTTGAHLQINTGYVSCQLCKNALRASRFSNLTNHARRHAAIKKYKCVHCDLQHNEHAKVRNHMVNAHGDKVLNPIDNTSPETQKMWDFLVQKCFPNCFASSSQSAAVENDATAQGGPKFTFVCGMCGYQGSDPWDVRCHIASHREETGGDANRGTIKAISKSTAVPEEIEILSDNDDVVEIQQEPFKTSETANGEEPEELFATVKEDVDANALRSLPCKLCNSIINGKQLEAVVMHAKAHYHIKQFECDRCGFGSNVRSLVKRHIQSQHRRGLTDIMEHNGENIRQAWTQVVRACFPTLPDMLEKGKEKRLSSGKAV